MSSLARSGFSLGLAAWIALACGTPPAPSPPAQPDLAASLVALGEQAFEAGDLASADGRFQRALRADPGSVRARIGLGRVALLRDDLAGAGARFASALDREPGSVPARLGLASVARRSGRFAVARAHLERVLADDLWCAVAHAELAELSGLAPRTPAADLDEALRRAREHPYDLAAGFAAGAALAAAGRSADASRQLVSILWLADLDPQAARAAWALLVRLDPAWSGRRAVRVDSFADESIRGHPGWRFRLRLAWLAVSKALDPLLGVRFLPATLQGFASREASASLDAIDAAFRAQATHVSKEGVLAAFTERAPLRGGGAQRLGQAEFLGRRLVVRLETEPGPSRVLLHEVLHLYGGVHVADDVESLMNPSGGALIVDPLNASIARELRGRRFHGGLERDVLAVIDLPATTLAYENALRVNFALRRAGLAEAVETATTDRVAARRAAARVRELDPHLGDVARFVSLLLWRGERPSAAAFLLETAARLYGPRTTRGREAAEEAERIWQQGVASDGSGR